MSTFDSPSSIHLSPWPQWPQNKPFAAVLLVLLLSLIGFLGAKIQQTLEQTEHLDSPTPLEHTITIEGEGKAIGKPDVATVNVGVDSKAAEVASAQEQNTATVNGLIDKIKALGISADDIQTSAYNVYENTEWDPGTQTYAHNGWVVSQTLTVKIRDTGKVSAVLAVAGQNGVTNVYGPNFTIDDPSDLKAEARSKAVADARAKAEELATSLGVTLGGVVSYSEYTGNGPIYPTYASAEADKSYGGAPTIEPGSNEIDLNVSLTYRIVD